MQKLGVASNDRCLCNAANVLFGTRPSFYHPQCAVQLARFEGTDKRVFIDQSVCDGNLFDQFDAVVNFCSKHLYLSGRMDGKYRRDSLTVPFEAIKEASINMLCHRSWRAENMIPSVAIYDDRMEFQNPGSFPIGTKWEDFADNRISSRPPNPQIAHVFYNCGIMEKWGRGVQLIITSCRNAGLPAPHFDTVASCVSLIIPFARPLSEMKISTPPAEKVRLVTNPARETITKKILEFCVTPRSLQEIAEMLEMKNGKWVRKTYILPLLGTNLQYTLPDKPKSKRQKYVSVKRTD